MERADSGRAHIIWAHIFNVGDKGDGDNQVNHETAGSGDCAKLMAWHGSNTD